MRDWKIVSQDSHQTQKPVSTDISWIWWGVRGGKIVFGFIQGDIRSWQSWDKTKI